MIRAFAVLVVRGVAWRDSENLCARRRSAGRPERVRPARKLCGGESATWWRAERRSRISAMSISLQGSCTRSRSSRWRGCPRRVERDWRRPVAGSSRSLTAESYGEEYLRSGENYGQHDQDQEGRHRCPLRFQRPDPG